MEHIENEALSFIRNNLSNKGQIFVGFSGGKDSIVTADLMKRSGIPFKLYYSQTGIDPPEVVRFIKKNYDCIFLKPKINFWKAIVERNPPAIFSRWCCSVLKKQPATPFKKHIPRVLGIRAEESFKRSRYKRIEFMRDIRRWIYLPIFHWNEGQIWEYIEKYNLPYPNLYDQGVSRIGCVICPFLSRKNFDNHRFSRNRWPRFYALFEKKCRQWFELRQSQGYEMYFETADDFISAWYRGNVQYYKYDEYPGQITFEDFF